MALITPLCTSVGSSCLTYPQGLLRHGGASARALPYIQEPLTFRKSTNLPHSFFFNQHETNDQVGQAMSPPRRALIAITSAHAPLYPEGKETGLFITEALHPFNVFRAAGFEVDLVSETGSYQPDWLSTTKDWLPEDDKKVWEDHGSEFRSKLDKLLKPSDIKADQVGLLPSLLVSREYQN